MKLDIFFTDSEMSILFYTILLKLCDFEVLNMGKITWRAFAETVTLVSMLFLVCRLLVPYTYVQKRRNLLNKNTIDETRQNININHFKSLYASKTLILAKT